MVKRLGKKTNQQQIAKPVRIRSKYVGKIDTVALLLLGGVQPDSLKEWYGITDGEIAQAQGKIRRLNLEDVKA